MTSHPNLRAGLLAVGILIAFAAPARAERATIDEDFLKPQIAKVEALTQEMLKEDHGPLESLEATRKLALTRHEALLELDSRHPLTTFDGIETQDRYDSVVARSLYKILDAGFHADSTAAPGDVVAKFSKALGPFPDLGPTPVGFMVMGLADLVLAGYDKVVQEHPAVSKLALAKAATQLLYAGTYIHHVSHEDQFADANASDFRYSSVIMRLRCPKDGGTYRVMNNKNKVNETGEISTVYYLECTTCKDTREIEFKLDLQTRLNQMADKQKMKKKPKTSEGLNP